jgi:hypothetical protein
MTQALLILEEIFEELASWVVGVFSCAALRILISRSISSIFFKFLWLLVFKLIHFLSYGKEIKGFSISFLTAK